MKISLSKVFLIIGAVGPILLSGCMKHDPDPPAPGDPMGTVHLTIAPYWAGAPFDKFQIYNDVLDHRVQVQFVKLYLADCRLDHLGGSKPLFDIDLFDLTDGPLHRDYTVPVGTYDGVSLGIGVPEALNHTDPALYQPDHPLGVNSGTWWSWASLRRFVLFDGRRDTIGTGSGPLPFTFSFHTGFDTCYRTLSRDVDLIVEQDQTTDLELRVDVSRFFYNSVDTLDLNVHSQWHGEPEDLDVALELSNHVRGSITAQ